MKGRSGAMRSHEPLISPGSGKEAAGLSGKSSVQRPICHGSLQKPGTEPVVSKSRAVSLKALMEEERDLA